MPHADSNRTAADEAAAIAATASRWVARRDAGLNAAETAELERWLAADPRHAHAIEDFGSAWSELARPLRTGAGNELLDELILRRRLRGRRRIGAAALGLVAIAALGLVWQRPAPIEAASPAPVVANALMRLPASRTLPDGSVVELKDGAEIAVDYSGVVRRIRLERGEVHFVVTKDSARPFVVNASPRVAVRAVGTAFSVQCDAAKVSVLVTEGRVAVEEYGSADPRPGESAASVPAEPRTLGVVESGNRMIVDLESVVPAPVVAAVPAAEMAERLAWREPRVEFNGTPLAECIDLFNRHAAGRSLRLDDPALGAMRVSGVFRATNIDSFVLLIEASFGIKSRVEGSVIHLHRPAP